MLDRVLSAKKFPAKWREWIANILTTGKINGINCKKGLRQSGPLSPYLFILVADVLQQLLTSAAANGVFAHPIVPSAPCPILQYADDTLIILKADKNQLFALKVTLQIFSIATRLHINFEKNN